MNTSQEHQPKKKLFVKLGRMITLNKVNKKFLYLLIFSLLILATFIIFQAKDYIPFNNEFSRTGDMNLPRYGHSAVLLKDDRVFIAGGVFRLKRSVYDSNIQEHLTAEVYEPKSGKFKIIGKMNSTHHGSPILTLLNNGKVLITSGATRIGQMGKSEIYDPIKNIFTKADHQKSTGRFASATLLPNGKVLFVGGGLGRNINSRTLDKAEIFNPNTKSFIKFLKTKIAHVGHTATLLKDGRVLITGGKKEWGAETRAEIYNYKEKE